MFSEINYMEQDSTKNRLALVKTNRVFLNICFLYKNYAAHNINIKARVRIIIPSLY